ncbi:MAG: cohesin domain-containing protein [Caldilineaceae bacterium]
MKRYLRATGSILLLLALLLAWGPGLALAAAGDVTLNTPKTTVDGNERFVVAVNVEAPAGLYGVQLSLAYDDTVLNVLNVSAGSAWPVADTFVARSEASGGGTSSESIEFAATLNSAGSLSGSAELVTILFEAVNPTGSTPVSTDIVSGSSLALSSLTQKAIRSRQIPQRH